MRAGLERAVQGCATRARAGFVERDDLGVRHAGALVCPCPTIVPSGETTDAPTIGLGVVWPRPRSASRSAPAASAASLPLLLEERVDVLVRREREQIVDAFADADVSDRQLQIVRDRDGDAALGRAIKFREDDAGDAGRRP